MITALAGRTRRRRRTVLPPRSVHAAGVERRYARAIRRTLAVLPQLVRELLLPRLPAIVFAVPEAINANDGVETGPPTRFLLHIDQDFGALITVAISGLRFAFERLLPQSRLEAIADDAARDTAKTHKAELARQVKAVLGVDPITTEPWLNPLLDDAVAANVALIRTIPTRYFDDLEQLVRRSVRAGRRHEELAEEIRTRFMSSAGEDLTKATKRAELIARDQTAKLTSDLARVRQERLGVSRYRWRTSLDERVREEHAAREGVIFSWDDPPPDGHPGEPIMCRCSAEPVLDDLVAEG